MTDKLTLAALMRQLRKVDPQASLEEHKWGFSIITTSSLETPQLLITNPRAARQT